MSNVPCTRSEGLLIFMSSVTETSTSALGKQGEPPLARSTTGAQAHLRTVRHFMLNNANTEGYERVDAISNQDTQRIRTVVARPRPRVVLRIEWSINS